MLSTTLRLAQVHQPRRTIELRNRLRNLILLAPSTEATALHISCWCGREDSDTLDLIGLLLAQPSYNNCVACMPCVEDFEADGWLIALAVEEFLLVGEGVCAELWLSLLGTTRKRLGNAYRNVGQRAVLDQRVDAVRLICEVVREELHSQWR